MRYIDADALKVKCEEAAKYANSHFEKRRGDNRATKVDEICTMFKHGIDAAPTADVAPVVHGEWEDEYKPVMAGMFVQRHKCSSCGNTANYKSKFCPDCGAKMGADSKEVSHE